MTDDSNYEEWNIVEDRNKEKEECKNSQFTREKIILVIMFCLMYFLTGMGYSLQAPFFPKEAAAKGFPSSVYGLIIGIYQLTNFIVAPFFGKYINRIGVKFLLISGCFTMAVSFTIFGLLSKVPSGSTFIALAFIIRMTEALGNSAFVTACFSITAKEFPDKLSYLFSYINGAFELGMVVGPTFGGYLYELNGYYLPFVSTGSVMFVFACIITFLMPPITVDKSYRGNIIPLLKLPSILIACFSVITVSFCFGFNIASLEPHLRQFNLRPTIVGLILIINGGVACLSISFWGFLARKCNLKILTTCGGILGAIGFMLLGPAPFIPIEPRISLIIASQIIYGIGINGEFLIPFLNILNGTISAGYPDNIVTYAIATALWNSSTAFGEFIGPTISGVLEDYYGFRNTTMLIVGLHCTVIVLNFGYYWKMRLSEGSNSEKIRLIS